MGIGWSTDYPYAGINLMIRLSELTRTPITKDAEGEPTYWVVHLTDPALFKCQVLMGSDVGTMELDGILNGSTRNERSRKTIRITGKKLAEYSRYHG